MEFLIHYPEFVHHEPIMTYKPTLYGFSINPESPAYRCNRFGERVHFDMGSRLKTIDSMADDEDEEETGQSDA